MELKLEREILRLKPELSIEQIHKKAVNISDYWITSCLEDVLEVMDEYCSLCGVNKQNANGVCIARCVESL